MTLGGGGTTLGVVGTGTVLSIPCGSDVGKMSEFSVPLIFCRFGKTVSVVMAAGSGSPGGNGKQFALTVKHGKTRVVSGATVKTGCPSDDSLKHGKNKSSEVVGTISGETVGAVVSGTSHI
jgi:hypothetical protein